MNEHRISFTYLSQEDLLEAGCFDMRMVIETAEKTLISYEEGGVLFPEKVVQIFNQSSQDRINCLPATLLDEKVCGVKWVSVFPNNPVKHDKQNLSAIFLLSEIKHGFPIAVVEGTLASNMRVAAMGAIAAKHLAVENSEVIGFIGSGEQAKMHLIGMKTVRPSLKQCRVASKLPEEEDAFIDELSHLFPDMEFIAARTNGKKAMEGADILVTATSAQAPLLHASWVKPGAFYSHIGGWEDEYDVALQSDKIVCDDWETVTHRTQTLSRMYKEGYIDSHRIHADLHELVSGHKVGRENDQERIYFNAVGLAYIDVAIGLSMYNRAMSAGIGTALDLQKSMIFEHADIAKQIRL
ncbi:ornithine cyclodeaminase, mu-crystallin-like protein [Solemya velum gill symbiont]|uniref:Ornithine cyclodeaminase, mu-crystallin-like protein n=2 Tax=Solemya velum gill symbiont TaxID=2340 RepID=A0A0B0H4F0_SOVGS|nr:ornithine cyclodeaminase family protein [Solemya velum gill symbiont]KHF25088.1 ornithine cyclodeaminase, mu-crystallin-like protein [Solemya velum gill symbiont]